MHWARISFLVLWEGKEGEKEKREVKGIKWEVREGEEKREKVKWKRRGGEDPTKLGNKSTPMTVTDVHDYWKRDHVTYVTA